MSSLSTPAKIGVAVGVAAAAVGAYMLYRHAANVVAEEEGATTTSSPAASASAPVQAEPAAEEAKPAKAAAAPAKEADTAAEVASPAPAATATAATAASPDAAGTLLTKDQLCRVLVGILQSTQMLVQTMMARQQKDETKLPAEQLKQMFEMQSSMLHQKILSSNGISHAVFQNSMMAHKDDAQVRALMAQSLRMGDALLPSIPEDMTLEKFLPILANVMDAFVTGTTAAVEEAKAAGLEGEELAQKTMELASVKVQDAQEAALTSVSMTKELFQACLTKYMSDARVQKTVMTAQQQAMQIVQDAAPAAQLS